MLNCYWDIVLCKYDIILISTWIASHHHVEMENENGEKTKDEK